MKLSDEMKDRIRKIYGILNSEEILEDYNVECMFLQEKKDLEEYLSKVEAMKVFIQNGAGYGYIKLPDEESNNLSDRIFKETFDILWHWIVK